MTGRNKRAKQVQILGGVLAVVGLLGLMSIFVAPDALSQSLFWLGVVLHLPWYVLMPTHVLLALMLGGGLIYYAGKTVIWYRKEDR